MPCLLAYLRESLDFFKVGIFGEIQTFGFSLPIQADFLPLAVLLLPACRHILLPAGEKGLELAVQYR